MTPEVPTNCFNVNETGIHHPKTTNGTFSRFLYFSIFPAQYVEEDC